MKRIILALSTVLVLVSCEKPRPTKKTEYKVSNYNYHNDVITVSGDTIFVEHQTIMGITIDTILVH